MTMLWSFSTLRVACFLASAVVWPMPDAVVTVRLTLASAPQSFVLAVMVVWPVARRVTKPPFTVATLSSLLDQTMRLSVVAVGMTVCARTTCLFSRAAVMVGSPKVIERDSSGSFCLSLRYRTGNCRIFEV